MSGYLFRLGESFLSMLGEKLLEFAFSQEDGATFESLRTNIRLLCEKAKDVDEQIKTAELCSRKKRKRAVGDWLDQVQPIESELRNLEFEMQREGFIKRFFGRGRAKKLDSRVRDMYEKSKDFGELVIDAYDAKGEKFSTNGLVGEEFEKNLKNIIRLLLVDKVPSIGIYGMGGVGKTTLVKHINNQLIEQTQERVSLVWITVSQEFTIATLQDKIAGVLGTNLSDEGDEDKRASNLNRVLSRKNNLILILDDVWEHIDLKKLGDPLSTNGCRLLITTRLKKVCNQIDCQKIIEVKTLKENEAWNLFNDALGQDENLTPEVEEIAKSLVKLCDGLPLGIITLAKSMKGDYDIRVWRDALEELRNSIMGQQDMDEQVFKVLKHSFDRLDRSKGINSCHSKLQLCFLYCSLFPEDWWIDRDEVIENFILEEFLDKRDSRKKLFDQGHAVLDQLVNVCLLERVDRDRVKMHDLLRAMALKIIEGTTKVIAGNKSLTKIPNDDEWTKELETMSLMMNDIQIIPDGMSPGCPKLSTLILRSNRLRFIPKSFFLQMCSLSILDLSSSNIEKLPDEVSNLEGLGALMLLRCYELVYVPCLGKLQKLRKLELSWTAIELVPEGIDKLINLQFLGLDGTSKLKMLPSNFVLSFGYLQCLILPTHIHVQVEELVELKHLEQFVGRVKDFDEFLQLIRWKNLDYRIVVQQLDSSSGSPIFPSLRYNSLDLNEYDLKKVKDEDVDVLDLGILRHLVITGCTGSSNSLVVDLAQLMNPTFLESLKIFDCKGFESIFRKEQCRGLIRPVGSTSTFSSIAPVVFTSLTKLIIFNCKNIKSLGISVLELPNLETIIVERCEQMEEIFEVNEENGRGQSGHVQFVSLSKLRYISLATLPKLKTICNTTIVCGSLKRIQVWGCESLKKFPVVFGQPNYDSPPSASMSINIHKDEKEWWEKLELGHPTHHSLLQPFIQWLP